MDKIIALVVGSVTVGLLAFVITWAFGRLRERRQKLLDATRPRCKHGADKFRGPRCTSCIAEAKAFFEEKAEATSKFKIYMPNELSQAFWGTSPVAVPKTSWRDVVARRWFREPNSLEYRCRTCGYVVHEHDLLDSRSPYAALAHVCQPKSVTVQFNKEVEVRTGPAPCVSCPDCKPPAFRCENCVRWGCKECY